MRAFPVLMLKALRERAIARLWFGQALSSIGDEIYRVALTWMVVGLIGADTGYLNAAQAAALMTLSFVGGRWADRWEPLTVMINVDFVRAGLVLLPVIYSFFAPVSLPILVTVALALSALGAFFDPALQTSLPLFSRDLSILRAATGLMSTTTRMARMIGPTLIGVLAGLMPPIHFFTLDALSFYVSALSVMSLRKQPVIHKRSRLRPKPVSMEEAIFSGFRAIRTQAGMGYVLLSKAITGGTWSLAYGLGFALLVQEMASHDTRAFGLLIAAYGLGNFSGALLFGNMERKRPALMMFIGYVWLGIGLVLVACSPTMHWMMFTAAVTGFSGTMNEVTFADLVQARFPIQEITRIFRLRMACDTASILLCMLISPLLFHLLSVRLVIALCGVVWVMVGLVGLIWKRRLKM